MKQMNCPVCDTECWFIYGDLHVVMSTKCDGDTDQIVVVLGPHECPKEKLEAMV